MHDPQRRTEDRWIPRVRELCSTIAAAIGVVSLLATIVWARWCVPDIQHRISTSIESVMLPHVNRDEARWRKVERVLKYNGAQLRATMTCRQIARADSIMAQMEKQEITISDY